jgi:predicted O-linked N-acetylglucosamine transferase (SPINDLY family)
MTEMTIEQGLAAAVQHHQAGRLPQAETMYRRILSLDPNHADAIHLLGVLAHQSGQQKEAHDLISRAIRLSPETAQYHCNLGMVLAAQGKLDEALAAYRRADKLAVNFATAHYNLGTALANTGNMREAIPALQRAIAVDPDLVDAHFALGNALLLEQRIPEAIAAYRQAIALRPNHPESYNNLGAALRINLQVDESIMAFEKALQLRPDFPDGHNNLANVYKDMGQLDLAIAHFDQSLAAHPNAPGVASNRVYTLGFHPRFDGPAILRELRQWNQKFAAPLKPFIKPHPNDRNPNRRLRIGYVSPDFRRHVIGQNLLPLFNHHDHEKGEIFCYASAQNADAMTGQFQAKANAWRSLRGVNDEQAADMIRQDQIDILIDLSLHVAHNRLLIFARKPAPVQATFGGYPGGTGLETMDYRISDQYLDPPEFDSHYVERTIRLPDSFWCYDSVAMGVAEREAVSPLPAQRNGYITFGCLNNFCKVHPGVLDLWAKVMMAVPDSHLLLMAPHGHARDWVEDRFKKNGVDSSRLQFVDRQEHVAYFDLYEEIDIGLDTFPYNGHTTSLDAMWMGVPVVTLVGSTVVGRAGWSQLSNLKLRKLAVQTPEKFVQIASELTKDLSRLADLRGGLRKRMQQSPLTDGAKFAANIEAAYRQMWQQWCGAV